MKKRLILLLCGIYLITGCAHQQAAGPKGEDVYELYFLAEELKSVSGDGALQAERIHLPQAEEMDTQAMAEFMMQELLKGPLNASLKNIIPMGTTLKSVEIRGSQAIVDLSAGYRSLSGIALTLADYAITLTLTQLSEIMSVKITVDGRELLYREQQVFTSREVLLAPQGDVVSTVDAVLYFLNESQHLSPEARTLELYEGDTQVIAIARALENGPENKELQGVLPEGFRLKSVWLEDDTCYVNLSSALLGNLPDDTQLPTAILALSKSLCSLDAVHETRFLVDGEFSRHYGSADISNPYTEAES